MYTPAHQPVPAQVGLGDLLGSAHATLADDADFEEGVGIEVDVLHVAVLERDAQLVGGRAVHVLDAEVFDLAALLPPVDELAFEVRLLRQVARVVHRGASGSRRPRKGSKGPAFLPSYACMAVRPWRGRCGSGRASFAPSGRP